LLLEFLHIDKHSVDMWALTHAAAAKRLFPKNDRTSSLDMCIFLVCKYKTILISEWNKS
jgi:hypothetical protein